MSFDDTDQDGKLQRLIVVHGNIAKTHHTFEFAGKFDIDQAALRQQRKYISRTLRHAQLFTPDYVLSHIQRCFASTLNVQDGRISICAVPRMRLPKA